jgi:hypothetical protein
LGKKMQHCRGDRRFGLRNAQSWSSYRRRPDASSSESGAKQMLIDAARVPWQIYYWERKIVNIFLVPVIRTATPTAGPRGEGRGSGKLKTFRSK